MNTPNKYAYSPYASTPKAKDVPSMYPSQSSDYISFHMGGQSHPTSAQKWRNEPRSSRGSYRGHYNNFNNRNNNRDAQQPQHQQQQNVPYFYQDRTPNDQQYNQQPDRPNRPNRRFNFQRIHMQHGVNKDMIDIMDFVHSSMLEDPWQSLIERHETIEACDLQLHVAKNAEDQDEEVKEEEEVTQERNNVTSTQKEKE